MAISLQKGQRISLAKDNGSQLDAICVGVNWGAIEKKSFFGTKKEAVDLDASVALFDANKEMKGLVYFGQLVGPGIRHSGDDRTGDVDGDDGLDNEVIQIKLSDLPAECEQVVVVLNSFKGQDFKVIPFASIRIYEGTPTRVDSEFARYDLVNDPSFHGSKSMVLGKFYRKDNEWKFTTIGAPCPDSRLEGLLKRVALEYV